ncbi:MAG TPA: SAM-dependent methyltransferase, partial [bacterium]|nr:SAM-dependent methyltransferase [bacterium]
HNWYYRGFLSQKSSERQKALRELRSEPYTTILMETPYRLPALLDDLETCWDSERRLALCWQLTTGQERVLRGTASEVAGLVEELQLGKGAFVIVLEGERA